MGAAPGPARLQVRQPSGALRHAVAPGARRVRRDGQGLAEMLAPRPRQLAPAHHGLHGRPRHVGARLRRRAALSARKRNKNGKFGKARTPKPLFVSTGTLKKSFFVDGAGNDSVAVATNAETSHPHYCRRQPCSPSEPTVESMTGDASSKGRHSIQPSGPSPSFSKMRMLNGTSSPGAMPNSVGSKVNP